MDKAKKILAIDDDKDILKTLVQLLKLIGYIVVSTDNGVEAIELAKKELPDLIICDIALPVVDGYSILKTLGQNEQTASIPFIFLTAKTEVKDIRKGMEAGADDYILKPFTMEELITSINLRFEKLDRIKSNYEELEHAQHSNKKLKRDSHLILNINNQPETVVVENIKIITSSDQYSSVQTIHNKKLLVRKSLNDWEDCLPEELFLRIHRSTIINLNFVEKFEKWFNGGFLVFMKEIKEPLEVSRRYRQKIKSMFDG